AGTRRLCFDLAMSAVTLARSNSMYARARSRSSRLSSLVIGLRRTQLNGVVARRYCRTRRRVDRLAFCMRIVENAIKGVMGRLSRMSEKVRVAVRNGWDVIHRGGAAVITKS